MGSPATRLGDVLNDAYELQELVSSTKQLEVYRARDKRTRSAVRVTVLRPEFALQGRVVDSFLRGPRSLAGVSHESLPLVQVDTDDTGIPFVVEETVEGRSLADLIASFPQGMPLPMIRQLSLPLIEALSLAHEQGMAHGSIDAEHVKLLGEAHAPSPKWIGLGAEESSQDANYRAPELEAAGAHPAPRSDVFALGVLIYSMLSGELPFRSGKQSAVPLDEIAPHLSRAWVELTQVCLEQQAGKRPPDALAVLTRLRACNDNAAPEPPRSAGDRLSSEGSRASGASLPAATMARGKAERRPKPSPKRDPRVDEGPQPAPAKAASAPPQATVAARGNNKPSPLPAASAPTVLDEKPPKDKKLAAQEAAEKLNAKHKPPKEQPAASPSPSPVPPPREPSAPPPHAAEPPLELAQVRKPAKPTPAQAAAVALTSAQLEALRALRRKDEEDRDRLAGIFFIVLFIALLHFGVPLLREPQMAGAKVIFGPQLRIAASAFSLVTVVAAVRVWVAQLHDKSFVQRLTTFLMQVIAFCIVLITATLFSHSAPLTAAAGLARRGLPWAMGGLFFLLAIQFFLRGVRQVGNDLLHGALILAISVASLYGSYDALVGSILAERKRAAAALMAKDASDSPADLKQELMDKSSLSDWQKRHQNTDTFEQRTHAGADEEDDLKSVEQIEGTRRQNQRELEEVRKGMADPPAESP